MGSGLGPGAKVAKLTGLVSLWTRNLDSGLSPQTGPQLWYLLNRTGRAGRIKIMSCQSVLKVNITYDCMRPGRTVGWASMACQRALSSFRFLECFGYPTLTSSFSHIVADDCT
jgi:hypothetical protein